MLPTIFLDFSKLAFVRIVIEITRVQLALRTSASMAKALT